MQNRTGSKNKRQKRALHFLGTRRELKGCLVHSQWTLVHSHCEPLSSLRFTLSFLPEKKNDQLITWMNKRQKRARSFSWLKKEDNQLNSSMLLPDVAGIDTRRYSGDHIVVIVVAFIYPGMIDGLRQCLFKRGGCCAA